MKTILISTYEFGHQPFGLASPVKWLEDEGFDVKSFDLTIEKLDFDEVSVADFIAFYLPMHTATRIAVPIISKLREVNPTAHICAYGLYAPMNAEYLRDLGVSSVIGGEFEAELVRTVKLLADTRELKPNGRTQKTVFLDKQKFKLPTRRSLPDLEKYAFLTMPDGSRKTVGYTEASRGCKHLCRHCPVVPVYNGRFMVVARDVVLKDIEQQVDAGARHITFGDPDFFNGITHAVKLIESLHKKWPDLTYDVTIKVEHLVKYADHLKTLQDTGCLFVTSAVESVDDEILARLDKGHSPADFRHAVKLCRDLKLGLNPTFVAFTPWISLTGYRDLLRTIVELDLVDAVSPVQLAIRLLIPKGSRLLELHDTSQFTGPFDHESLCYSWRHPDPRVDQLQTRIGAIVEDACKDDVSRLDIFKRIWNETVKAIGEDGLGKIDFSGLSATRQPYLSEDWYCCAEPTSQQMEILL